MSKETLLDKLRPYRQAHVLRCWDTLLPTERQLLTIQIDSLDLDALEAQRSCDSLAPVEDLLASFTQPEVITPSGTPEDERAKDTGEALLRNGQIGLVLVAGGQGTRLKFDGPKGCFPITPIHGRTLFELHAEKIAGLRQRYGGPLALYVMTSDATDEATREFFATGDNLGLGGEGVRFFKQANMPVVDREWKMLMSTEGSIAMSPNGHGGCIDALRDSGMLADMRRRGITDVFYFQVDNVLVQIADPLFMGYHRMAGAEMSLKVLEKRDPLEGLGAVGCCDGRLHIIEYSDLSDEQKHERDHEGRLKYRMGSIAIHAFTVDFLERMSQKPRSMPFHQARKDVPYVDEEGVCQEPQGARNGTKFEKFIFDALPEAENALVFETVREHDFAPVKNVEGEDSPRTAKQSLVTLYADWLSECGIELPRDRDGNATFAIEISPLFALDAEDLRAHLADGLWIDSRGFDGVSQG